MDKFRFGALRHDLEDRFMNEKRKVLVIEDNQLNLKLVRSLLDLNGFDVVEAMSAESGIERAGETKPDLILMDIQLPGMDGLEATRILKADQELGKIPVVALTSYAMQGDEKRTLDAGCSGYISKPIDTRAFIPKLENLLGQQPRQLSRSVPGKGTHSNRPRILIADDDPLNIKVMKGKLPERMYELFTVGGGVDCVEAANALLPDLVLLDVMMPDLNGYEVTWKLKTSPRTGHIPIILVTTLDSPEDKAKGLEVGADEFLTKPVSTVELQTRVQSMLKLKKYFEQLELRTQSEMQLVASAGVPVEIPGTKDVPKILLAEDNPHDLKLLSHYLSNLPYQLMHTADGRDALALAKRKQVDLMILDVLLPGMDGFEICRNLKQDPDTKNIQVMMITCLTDIENKLIGVETGTDDFLVKPVNQREFLVRVKALLKKKSYIDQIRRHSTQALNSSMTDGLTMLYNRSYLSSFLDFELKRSKRFQHCTILMMMDIDDFKSYNDTHGHLTGDEIIKEMGVVICGNLREIDMVARYGGDEFAVVLPYIDIQTAARVARRMIEAVERHHFTSCPDSRITLSVGIAECPTHAQTPEALIEKADMMLYEAKRAGKNTVVTALSK